MSEISLKYFDQQFKLTRNKNKAAFNRYAKH